MPTLPLATSVRTLNRLQQVARVLARHGFGHVVERMNLARFLPMGKRFRAERAATRVSTEASLGRRLAAVCADLGPAFVKLGQMISTRPDLASEDILRELQKLQDHVPPFDHEVAMAMVASDLGEPIAARYAWFDSAPFACGSIGQVYHARTLGGEEVVVKVKRPGIEDIVRNDLHLLKWLAATAEQWIPELASLNPPQVIDEFEQLLTHEMDYINEASATARFEEAFASDEFVHIPHVHWELTGPRVLTLGRVRGSNLEALMAGDRQSIDSKVLARRLVNLYLHQFFDLRLFHADPHPGNILISPPARVGLIDFGQVGAISDELAGHLVVVILALLHREPQLVVDVLSDLGAIEPETDVRALARALRQLLDKYHGLPLKRLEPLTVFSEMMGVIRAHDVTLPREMVLVFKTLITIGGVAVKLDPDLDLVAIVTPRLKSLIAGRLSPARLARSAGVSLWHVLNILKAAPAQVRAAVRQISRGKWQVNIRHENLDRLTDELDRSSNRLAFSIVIAAVIVGSSVVISTDAEFRVLGIPIQWFGVAGYLFAGLLGVGLLWAIFRSGRLS